MSTGNRKPLIFVAVLAVVAIAVFALGAGFGGRGSGGAAGWQDRFAGFRLGSDLTMAELRPTGGSCRTDANRIVVTGSCVLSVAEFGGPFSFEATKQASFVPASPVEITLAVEGTSATQEVDPGCQVNTVFGRSGGSLAISCRGFVPECVVQLGPGRDCSE
ncbi:hypothetical protein D477_002231 [Arthrobacter crystallopoietes BAB-32]|uniref:Uncharacterized protein n=1 Tax=Arthrobacter crystallopoietes BAB-32 TaxID=1246476 RepID=N1V799_9MICC|nr:hypothetical protein [Arthrobacter crystallopoietes]EMY35864.1 hypothetical protein D477_002231 [Arthrobacter crystallopoietes BAB-32]